MKYLGKERQVEVKTKSVRDILYVKCDKCDKKILPYDYKRGDINSYVRVHTWHSDWGNDSVDSHKYHDLCKECAKTYISNYIEYMDGSEELELEHCWVHEADTYEYYDPYDSYWEGYSLDEEAQND